MIHDSKQLIHLIYKIPALKKLSNYRCFELILENIESHVPLKVENLQFRKGKLIFYIRHPTVKLLLLSKKEDIYKILNFEECQYIKENIKCIECILSDNFN